MNGDNKNKKKPTTKQKSLKEIFLELAQPDADGFSKEILMSDLLAIEPRFATGNGGDWCRSDGSLREYNIVRNKEKNKIHSVKLDGFNKNSKERPISDKIRKEIAKRTCVVLGIGSNIECDHKDGMYDDVKVANVNTQTINDFQPLSKNANTAKRQHCKVCKATGIRFDAKKLGYSQSYTKGTETTKSCKGCFWYDPKEFNSTISKEYKKDM